jgi:hypothetical protein
MRSVTDPALFAASVQKKTDAVARIGFIFPINGLAYLLLPSFEEVERENLRLQATANAVRNSRFLRAVNKKERRRHES